VEIDFHGRRTLVEVEGGNLNNATLQVDVGSGTFVEINDKGAFMGSSGPDFSLSNANLNPLPGLTVSRFKLTKSAPLTINSVTIRNVASNVSLGLANLPPFWTHLGDLIETQTSTDFAELLQAYLTDSHG
jgi:hypothetical protein